MCPPCDRRATAVRPPQVSIAWVGALLAAYERHDRLLGFGYAPHSPVRPGMLACASLLQLGVKVIVCMQPPRDRRSSAA